MRAATLGVFAVIAVALGGLGCKFPVPLGPDLVSCSCACHDNANYGNVSGTCGGPGFCEKPCDPPYTCTSTGGCQPSCVAGAPPATSVLNLAQPLLHVCVDASNPSNAETACATRCGNYASSASSAVSCVRGVAQALGLDIPPQDSIPEDIAQHIDQNSQQAIAQLIISECGQVLIDAVTGTCGLSTSGPGALVDIFLCVFSFKFPDGTVARDVRTCNSIPDGNGKIFELVQKNGCPSFQPDGGTTTGGGTGTSTPPPPLMPIGAAPLPATAFIASGPSSVTVSGSDVNPAASNPSGTASTGRIGSIMLLSQLDTTLPDGNLTVQGNDVTLSAGFLKLEGPVAATLSNGAFNIPVGRLRAIVTGFISGKIASVEAVNDSPVVGLYDEASGTFQLTGGLVLNGLNATVQLNLVFGFINRPPLANAGPDQKVECTLPTREGVVQLSAAQSADPDSGDHIANYTWTLGNAFVADGPTASAATAHTGLGTRIAMLATTDTHGSQSRDGAMITVVDTKPPVFAALPAMTNTLCNANNQSASIPAPAPVDACDPASVKVTGVVITSNGKPLSPPLPIQNGQARLPVGVHVVRWTATDGSGNSSTATQTINVRPAIEASDAIAIDDRATIVVAGGGFAILGDSGTGLTDIGVQAQTGSLITKGAVFLRDRSIVNGDILAGGAITKQNLTTITGTSTQNTAVTIPAGRNLAGIVFPTTNQGNVSLEPPAPPRTIAPGSYAAVTVKTGATLTLTAGVYFFTSLDLEPGGKLNLNQGPGAIQLYVRSSIIDRGQIATVAGTAAGFVLGYAGTTPFVIEAPFPAGTIIAPSAQVVVGSLGATPPSFAGQLSAKSIEVRPDAVVTCQPVPGATP
jgi:hypothetical protein